MLLAPVARGRQGFNVNNLKKRAEARVRKERPAPAAAKPSMMDEMMMARMNRRRSIMTGADDKPKPSVADVAIKAASAAKGSDSDSDGDEPSSAIVPAPRKPAASDSDSDASEDDWASD